MNSSSAFTSDLHELTLFWIEGVGIASVALVGLGVNLFAIWRLSFGLRKSERHCFHHLLLSLSVCDLIHIILTVTCFSLPQLSVAYRTQVLLHAIPFLIPLAQMSLCSSSLTTVALTVERYISLCWPYLRYRFNIKAWYFIVTVVTFSVLYNTPRFFEWMTYTEAVERPCFSSLLHHAQLEPNASPVSVVDVTYPSMTDMEILETLDDEALEEIIRTNSMSMHHDQTESVQGNCTETVWNVTLVPRELRKNHTYVLVYINWMNFIVNLMFPLATLLSLNLSIYRGLQSLHKPHANSVGGAIASPKPEQHQRCTSVIKRLARMSNSDAEQTASQPPSSMIKPDSDEDERDRDARFARASILMVLVFGLCHTPRLITNTMEMFIDQANLPAWVEVLVCVNHLLVTINSSFNFLIYLMGSKRKPNNSQSTSYQTTMTVMRKSSSQSSNHACPANLSVFTEVNGHLASPRNGPVQIELKFLDENNRPFQEKSHLSDHVTDV